MGTNLNKFGGISINKLTGVFSVTPSVIVEFAARSTRPSVTHLPEVFPLTKSSTVRKAPVQNNTRQNSLSRQKPLPKRLGFVISREPILLITTKVGGVESFWIQSVNIYQQIVGPRNSLLFEVVPKGPVAKHFKEGVVVGVLT